MHDRMQPVVFLEESEDEDERDENAQQLLRHRAGGLEQKRGSDNRSDDTDDDDGDDDISLHFPCSVKAPQADDVSGEPREAHGCDGCVRRKPEDNEGGDDEEAHAACRCSDETGNESDEEDGGEGERCDLHELLDGLPTVANAPTAVQPSSALWATGATFASRRLVGSTGFEPVTPCV